MPDPRPQDNSPLQPASPVVPPQRRPAEPAPGAPDLSIEEIEERHVPKDRNIFDK